MHSPAVTFAGVNTLRYKQSSDPPTFKNPKLNTILSSSAHLGVLIVEEAVLDALDVLPPRGVPLLSPGSHGLRRPEPEGVHRGGRERDGLERAEQGACPRLSEIVISSHHRAITFIYDKSTTLKEHFMETRLTAPILGNLYFIPT